jgi:hypothetical protein
LLQLLFCPVNWHLKSHIVAGRGQRSSSVTEPGNKRCFSDDECCCRLTSLYL